MFAGRVPVGDDLLSARRVHPVHVKRLTRLNPGEMVHSNAPWRKRRTMKGAHEVRKPCTKTITPQQNLGCEPIVSVWRE